MNGVGELVLVNPVTLHRVLVDYGSCKTFPTFNFILDFRSTFTLSIESEEPYFLLCIKLRVIEGYDLLFPFSYNVFNVNVQGVLFLITMIDFIKGLIDETFGCDLNGNKSKNTS